MSNIIEDYHLQESALWTLTTMVQIGFILGTLFFAVLAIIDRFSPSKVFFVCALLGAAVNAGILWEENTLNSLLVFRFFTGFFLAGIYPVGMKIASDYYKNGLGKALGYLVGALVLGTSLPHLLKELSEDLPWKYVIIVISILSIIGGIAILLFISNGPYRIQGKKIKLEGIKTIFKNKNFNIAALGYFGHMWELYTFWVFVPVLIKAYIMSLPQITFNIPLWSCIIIATGGLGCVAAGYLSSYLGVKKTAFLFLSLSLICCLLSPLFFETTSVFLFIIFMLFWGFTVAGDSPLFSSLVANNSLPEIKGTAITIVTSIGFAITVISIELVGYLASNIKINYLFLILAIGPSCSLAVYLFNGLNNKNATTQQ
ncbi:hypothetical protein SCB49_11774 [unidentified eubacterium SCB49]|nr:hypothetical protein SCB49_11774 [unidentified eubacterium SCB49]